ncbi:uncharacterized protein [Primulina huaijiensis]|uniref:uncharacterized protein n=1 Tax=Primulina huaijiensis TaxID=1492673 RepID=UPI003CC79C20
MGTKPLSLLPSRGYTLVKKSLHISFPDLHVCINSHADFLFIALQISCEIIRVHSVNTILCKFPGKLLYGFSEFDKMQAAKETAANVTASARSGMDKTKASVQGKAEEMKTRDPLQKEMAAQKKEAKIQEAEREKQGAVQQNNLARHEAEAGGFGHGYTTTGGGTTGTGGNHHAAHTAGGAVPGGAGHVGGGHLTGTGRHAI